MEQDINLEGVPIVSDDPNELENEGNPDETNQDDPGSPSKETEDKGVSLENNGGGDPDTEDENSEEELLVRVGDTLKSIPIDQARDYTSKGMVYAEKVLPKLHILAGAMGKNPDELLDALIEERVNTYREKLSETILDGDLVERLVAAEREKWNDSADLKKEENHSWDSKMAEEFLELQKEYPELKDFKSVDQKVIRIAAKKGISLLSAQLLYDRNQAKKADTQKAQAQSAAKSSAGKMEGHQDVDEFSEFKKSLWG